MNFKRFNGSTWETVQHKIYGSGTEQLASFPAQIQASGEPLTDYLISGNTVQDGTPTPEAPADVVGCGERTGNLFDISTATLGKYINAQGVETDSTAQTAAQALNHTDYIKIQPNTDYTYHYKFRFGVANTIALCWFDASKNIIYRNTKNVTTQDKEYTLMGTSPANAAFCIINFTGYLPNESMKLSFNAGSTALPYEPYGYKIPITVNGTEYPIYFGQVPTTRKIKKLVLDGTENWKLSSTPNQFYIDSVLDAVTQLAPMCTHFKGVSGLSGDNQIVISASQKINIRTTHIQHDLTDWINYLQQQYAAGTPVTIWYVLATPETAVVNEPLHKIGDHADTITMEQAGETIPTIAGSNTLSVGTTVQPSAMSATFKGWHPVQGAKVYDGNDWS